MTTVTGIGVLTTSCYTLQPVAAAVPEAGTRLAFAINDLGRVALGGSMGPELLRVEGSLQRKDGDEYVVNVAGVQLLQGGFQTWGGETVRINTHHVSAVYERKFSKGRTAVAVGAATLVAAVLVPRGIRSFLPPEDETPVETVVTRRGRPPFPLPTRPGLPPFLRSF